MTSVQEAVASAARALIGVRFRSQGREPRFGLDCIGVVTAALATAGRPVDAPLGYAQRGGDPADVLSSIDALPALVRIDPATSGAGDILLMMAGTAQCHLGIVSAAGLVHADAGLRQVVETPGPPRWPVLGAWRVGEEG